MNGTSTVVWRQPRRELQPVFSTVWTRMSTAPIVQISRIPDGCGDLIWCDGTLLVLGPDITPSVTTLNAYLPLVGMRFQPGAAATWLRAAAPELLGLRTTLDAFEKVDTPRLYEKIGDAIEPRLVATRLEEALVPTLTSETMLRPCMKTVMQLLERDGSTELLAGLRTSFGMSERTVRRESVRVFGYSPKMLERIFRVQRFLGHARTRPASLAWHAATAGFSDQAHMTREVRALAGITPRQVMGSSWQQFPKSTF